MAAILPSDAGPDRAVTVQLTGSAERTLLVDRTAPSLVAATFTAYDTIRPTCDEAIDASFGHFHVARARARCHGSGVNETLYPVTVLVQRPDGSKEEVRVGTAVRTADGFRLSLGELSIGATPDRAPAATPARRAPGPSAAEGPVFPPYGRSKGMPIAGASIQDLEFYIQGSRRSLDDPSKARFHDKERVLLAAMEAELSRQKGGAGGERGAGERGMGERGRERAHEESDVFDEPSPFDDDDIPF